jgi:hypothetical protein
VLQAGEFEKGDTQMKIHKRTHFEKIIPTPASYLFIYLFICSSFYDAFSGTKTI